MLRKPSRLRVARRVGYDSYGAGNHVNVIE